jgi:putative spermidine/putrescine transport system permease protein
VINVSATLYGFDEALEYAAMSLGASRWGAFRQVTLPLIRPGVLAGALFAFVTSFDELIVALFVSGTTAVTLPRRMWEGIRFEIDPTIAAVSTMLQALSGRRICSCDLCQLANAWLFAGNGLADRSCRAPPRGAPRGRCLSISRDHPRAAHAGS